MSAQLEGILRNRFGQAFHERSARRLYEKDILNSGPSKLQKKSTCLASKQQEEGSKSSATRQRDTGRHNGASTNQRPNQAHLETNTGQATRRDQKREHRRKTQGAKRKTTEEKTRRFAGACTKFPAIQQVLISRVPAGGRVSRFPAAVRARTHAVCAADLLWIMRPSTRLGAAHRPPSEDEDEVAVCEESLSCLRIPSARTVCICNQTPQLSESLCHETQTLDDPLLDYLEARTQPVERAYTLLARHANEEALLERVAQKLPWTPLGSAQRVSFEAGLGSEATSSRLSSSCCLSSTPSSRLVST